MFYTEFCSASFDFIEWVREEIKGRLNILGHLTSAKRKNTYYQLKYAKKDSTILVTRLYKSKKSIFLTRKKLKINKSLAIMGLQSL